MAARQGSTAFTCRALQAGSEAVGRNPGGKIKRKVSWFCQGNVAIPACHQGWSWGAESGAGGTLHPVLANMQHFGKQAQLNPGEEQAAFQASGEQRALPDSRLWRTAGSCTARHSSALSPGLPSPPCSCHWGEGRGIQEGCSGPGPPLPTASSDPKDVPRV